MGDTGSREIKSQDGLLGSSPWRTQPTLEREDWGLQTEMVSKDFRVDRTSPQRARKYWGYSKGTECMRALVAQSCLTVFVTPWTVACQVPLSVGFPRQEYWSGLPFPSPGDLPGPGIEPVSPSPAGGFFTTETPGKPKVENTWSKVKATCSDLSNWETSTMFEPQFFASCVLSHSKQQISSPFCVKYCSQGSGAVEESTVPVYTSHLDRFICDDCGNMSGRMPAMMLITIVVGDGIWVISFCLSVFFKVF